MEGLDPVQGDQEFLLQQPIFENGFESGVDSKDKSDDEQTLLSI